MKKTLFTLISLAFVLPVIAQLQFNGRILEQNVASPISKATVKAGKAFLVTDENGMVRFRANPGDSIEISAIGFKTITRVLTSSTMLEIFLEKEFSLMQPVEINAVRASYLSPFTQTTLSARAIEKANLGQDLPFLLNQTPSVVVNADAGNGIGYTGIRIRGSDATRINMTINGIPYNDAESQGLFFVNLPDLASSVNSIQVQRGVGTSSNGAGAFGATMNFMTNELNPEAYAEINNSYGSFNTWKNTVKVGTGLINKHFSLDARLSNITSDGFVDRASTSLQSFYTSAAYTGEKNSLRLNVFSGKEKTYQAWYGIPESKLTTDRTYNAAGMERPGAPYDNETDNYRQTHYQLFYNQALNPAINLNIALFYTRGLGYYEQYKADDDYANYGLPPFTMGNDTLYSTDLIRQLWLDNHFFGNTFSLQYKKNSSEWILGGGLSKYIGNHYGKVIWAEAGVPDNYMWYNLDALKTDANLYLKWQQKLANNLVLFADVQGRSVRYDIDGFRNNPGLIIRNKWFFVNPKAGVSYSKNNWKAYLSYAIANKEPNRDDFEAGATQQPAPEQLQDIELGIEKRGASLSWGATLFYMQYRNQLVLTGQINDVGAYTRVNIPRSFRTGIELTASWRPSSWFDLAANLAYSENKVRNFTAFYDDYDDGGQKTESFEQTDLSFSPRWVGGATLNVHLARNLDLSLINKYVSRQYLDNTSRKSRSLDPFLVQDLRVSYRILPNFMKEILLIGQVNNLLNVEYEPNGYTFSYYFGGSLQTENYYFPMAGTNAMLALNLKF
ncbi:MAG: TonB-dependent receptor [Sphingobacteriales bacterium]|jgi:iron complex outermembrane receptor protein